MSHDHANAANHGDGSKPSPEMQAAQERVERAREELRIAQEHVDAVLRQESGDEERPVIREVLDEVLCFVKKHPVPSLLTAASIGFFLGRLFRR